MKTQLRMMALLIFPLALVSLPASEAAAGAFELKPASELIDRPLVDLTLHDSMAALEPLKDRIAIVQGLSGKMCRGGHSSWFGAMGCYRAGGEHDSCDRPRH